MSEFISARALSRHLDINHSIINRELAKGSQGRLGSALVFDADGKGHLTDLETAAAAWRATRRPRVDDVQGEPGAPPIHSFKRRGRPRLQAAQPPPDQPPPPAQHAAQPVQPQLTPARRAPPPPPSGPPPRFLDYQEAKARKETAHAEMAELDLAVRQGKLVEVEAIKLEVIKRYTAVRTKMLGVPTRMKQRLSHLSAADVLLLDDLIREALDELADGRPGPDEGPDDNDDA